MGTMAATIDLTVDEILRSIDPEYIWYSFIKSISRL